MLYNQVDKLVKKRFKTVNATGRQSTRSLDNFLKITRICRNSVGQPGLHETRGKCLWVLITQMKVQNASQYCKELKKLVYESSQSVDTTATKKTTIFKIVEMLLSEISNGRAFEIFKFLTS